MLLSVPGCDEVLAETATESTLEAEIDPQPLRCTVDEAVELWSQPWLFVRSKELCYILTGTTVSMVLSVPGCDAVLADTATGAMSEA